MRICGVEVAVTIVVDVDVDVDVAGFTNNRTGVERYTTCGQAHLVR
jgi:hypothetical protein